MAMFHGLNKFAFLIIISFFVFLLSIFIIKGLENSRSFVIEESIILVTVENISKF